MMRSTNVQSGRAESVGPGRIGYLLGTLALVFLGGCDGGGRSVPNGDSSISGTVTWQAKPLAQGTISFVPASGEDRSGDKAAITNGHYEFPNPPGLPSGSYKVQIHAKGTSAKNAPASEPPQGVPDFDVVDPGAREQIPQKYNDETTLAAEVVKGSNTLNFDLSGTRSAARSPGSPRRSPEAGQRRGPGGRDPL